MSTLQESLLKITEDMPYYYLQELCDYAVFLKTKTLLETDTQFFENIPGLVESILEASKEEIKDCSKEPFGKP